MTGQLPRARAVDARRDIRRSQWPGSKRPASTTFASWSIAIEPYQPDPLPIRRQSSGDVELVREAATLVMLAMTGMLAGRTWRARWATRRLPSAPGTFLYYVFLRIISGWPGTLFDWDILFLLPLPWWGPVLAPVCIASLMIVWGTLVTQWR